jgi:hypothetical protein
MRCSIMLLSGLGLLASLRASPSGKWAHLRAGMSPAETVALLGRPLIRSASKGFELWIYDSKAEVVFHSGPVMAWTVPTPNPASEARPIEADLPMGEWQRLPVAYRADSRIGGARNEESNRTRFHYRQR